MTLPLPIDAVMPQILAALSSAPAVVVRAPTGAGKTTRIPPALLAAGLAGDGRVVVLEPRRVAARAAARRMAVERGWALGDEVGYQVRFDRRAGGATRILVVTEGILVGMLQRDPFLEGVGAILFDELHERRLDSDLALAMARRVQRQARPDLRLVAMSATLETGPVAELLGGCPVIESRGRLHPVEVVHLDAARLPGAPRPGRPPEGALLRTAVGRALAETPGDVLVFLPGVGEIRRAARTLAALARERAVDLVPLHGTLPPSAQDAALRPGERRRVVLSTNVAETSVTLEGITAVVDTGWVRRPRYDPATGLDRLELARASRSSAEQRAGRAGRLGPGLCLRLWSEHEHRGLPPTETPEIARVDLAAPTLQLLAWGESDPAAFDWLEPPDAAALERALELLGRLGALDRHGITSLGRTLAELPVHPRLGRLLVEGHRLGIVREAALAAVLLAERDPFPRRPPEAAPPPPSRSDLLDRIVALERFERTGEEPADTPLAHGAARFVLRARNQLTRRAGRRLGPPATAAAPREEALGRALLAAYPDRLVRRREPLSPRGVMVGGKGVVLATGSAVRSPELFLALDVDAGRAGVHADALVRKASGVEAEWLGEERLSTTVEVELDAARGRVIARRRTRFDDLVIDAVEVPAPDGDAAAVLARAAGERPEVAVPLDEPELASFLARLRCLAAWRPELGLPTFDRQELARILPPLCAGRRSLAELRRLPWVDILSGTLTHGQRQALERQAPERLEVPSGSRLRLRYEPGRPPVLAVRIQELFGLADTPRVAGGKVPVLLHLLAPNQRPQQVTQDLRSFWERTYPEVRKELQGRYPKHAWPDDPARAAAERRPRRRR